MAERRMFSRSIVESARFLKMPATSQLLYFHLGMNADDDGIVEAYSVLNLTRANQDDLAVLASKGFISILNEDLVSYIIDWRTQNYLRADRKKDSIYKNLLLQMHPSVELLEKKQRSDLIDKSGPSIGGPVSAQCSVGNVSSDKNNIDQFSVLPSDTQRIIYRLDDEFITENDYQSLTSIFPASVVDEVIERVIKKPYHHCLNIKTISAWCQERICHTVIGDDDMLMSRIDEITSWAIERNDL